ncbi:MAG: hypothetical protein H6742_00405 [Alphaproteobacteria bacterium]|nr:hypothetical protein [Alphaproteobacteria bacterium]
MVLLPASPRAALGPFLLLPLLGLLAGCAQDQGLSEIRFERVATALGDFDHSGEVLSRLGVSQAEYEGFIVGPVWDDELDPDSMAARTEDLFFAVSDDGVQELFLHDAVFVDSGTRGLGDRVYNGLDPDDALLEDPRLVDNVRTYVEAGHALVVSDWAWELVEAAWPDQVAFLAESDGPDAAQVGMSEEITARVLDAGLTDALGGDTTRLAMDYSAWTVVETVGPDVTVLLEGDALVRPDPEAPEEARLDLPLLLSFPAGKGVVVFSAFHWRAQRGPVADALLQAALPGLATNPGEGA